MSYLRDVEMDKDKYERMLYWIIERHAIHQRRFNYELPPPWTHDEVLANNFFTSPFRELDKVTTWFRENVRNDLPLLTTIFGTVAFRWFNWIPTGELLLKYGLFNRWNSRAARGVLQQLSKDKTKIFSNAYVIKLQNATPKWESVCNQLDDWWENRVYHHKKIVGVNGDGSLEDAWKYIKKVKYLGGFMSYEIVSDLRHTKLFKNAPDVMTWCNTGPGCNRGILRLRGVKPEDMLRSTVGNKMTLKGSLDDCRYLLSKVPSDISLILAGQKLIPNYGIPERTHKTLPYAIPEVGDVHRGMFLTMDHFPKFEMREIEHSLCEFDKFDRVFMGEGRSKRGYVAKA